MTTCPKCNKPAWVVRVNRRGLKGVHPTSYFYLRYRHYAGSRKSITLKALNKILTNCPPGMPLTSYGIEFIMLRAKAAAGEKTVDHYVREQV